MNIGCFHESDLNNPGKWQALRLKDRGNVPDARLRFEYHYPFPNDKVDHDSLLDYLSPALCAYCAGREFLRTDETDLYEAFIAYFSIWRDRQNIISLFNVQKASKMGRMQTRKADPEVVKKFLSEGKTQKWIAAELNVTPQAISKIKKQLS